MNSRVLMAVALNVIFVAILLIWPLMNSPKFTISIEEKTVPLGGKLNFTISFPSVPSEVTAEVVDAELNRTVYVTSLPPRKEIRGSIDIEEGKYRIGFHILRIRATLNGQDITEESYFSVFGAPPLELELKVENPVLTVRITNATYAEVSNRVYARVTMGGKPVENAKLLAVSLGSNSTVTEYVKTDSEGRASLEWRANVTGNSTFRVVVQAMKPGHPIASGDITIEVIVRKD
jgi:hypothetical protein